MSGGGVSLVWLLGVIFGALLVLPHYLQQLRFARIDKTGLWEKPTWKEYGCFAAQIAALIGYTVAIALSQP